MVFCFQQEIIPFVKLFGFDHRPRQVPMQIQIEQVLDKIGLARLLVLLLSI